MPAPLVAAASYFGLPRLLGGLADKAMQSRYEDLVNRGVNPETDTLLHALNLVPRQSGLESMLQDLDYLRTMSNTPVTPVPDVQEQPAGYQVTRELPYDQGVVFNTPMEDFLKYGGRDDDSGMSSMDLLRQDFDRDQSYGQTDQPATEVRFDAPLVNPETGEEYKLQEQAATESPRQQQGGGFANGGLADLLRMMYAQRQR